MIHQLDTNDADQSPRSAKKRRTESSTSGTLSIEAGESQDAPFEEDPAVPDHINANFNDLRLKLRANVGLTGARGNGTVPSFREDTGGDFQMNTRLSLFAAIPKYFDRSLKTSRADELCSLGSKGMASVKTASRMKVESLPILDNLASICTHTFRDTC